MILYKVKKNYLLKISQDRYLKKRNEVDYDIFNKYQAEVSGKHILRTLPLTDRHVDTPDVHSL